ncbi:DUF4760 domain-containing protein [Acinetobacter sp.]|uniref:DUF4760 domain-containing protein n=1 Tax=Acinetobacter sp. TaxID=472 RepID=UPI002FD8BB05
MANQSTGLNKGSITFFLALAAFLISIYLIFPSIIAYLRIEKWSVGDWLLFLQLLVFAVSAYIAYTTIHSSKTTARERATLDTILDDNKDELLSSSKVIVLNYDKNPYKYLKLDENDFKSKFSREACTTLSELCEREATELVECEADIRRHLIMVLSRHEFYAVGINTGLLDEQLFKRMHCNNIIRLWDVTSPAITHIRKKSQKPTFFKELESLAVRWKDHPLTENDIKHGKK